MKSPLKKCLHIWSGITHELFCVHIYWSKCVTNNFSNWALCEQSKKAEFIFEMFLNLSYFFRFKELLVLCLGISYKCNRIVCDMARSHTTYTKLFRVLAMLSESIWASFHYISIHSFHFNSMKQIVSKEVIENLNKFF